MTVQTLDETRALAQQLRVDSIRCSTSAGSGHPTSSMSAADLMAVLMARHFRYDWQQPDDPANDHLIFSKGHASPLLYSMFKAAGVISDEELMTGYRRFGSRLEGHPTPILPWVDVATGSLGQGLPDGVGVALAGKYLDELPYRVWVLCGDSEMAEGSMWEALDKAAYYGLSNLTAIVDVNRLGQRGPTELGWDLDAYVGRVEGFGGRAIPIDGHNVDDIDQALTDVADTDQPTVILARTRKGRGFDEVEDREGWHGRPLPADMAERAIIELGGPRNMVISGLRPEAGSVRVRADGEVTLPRYEAGVKVATRLAFGQALAAVGARQGVVALDGEVDNSTHLEEFAKAHPGRYFEIFIAEQQLIAASVGLSVRGYIPFAATFAAFLTRAFDFIRMSAISQANIRLCGSHAGTEIGADGPSQMALEDLAMMRAVHGSTVLYPSDATSTARLVLQMADRGGVVYMRTTRGAYPVLYGPDEEFPVGGAKVVRSSAADRVTLIGAGVTLHNCLAAADELGRDGIAARVVDLYSIKPIDTATLLEAAGATGDRLVVVEDHYPEGGIGGAVLEAFSDAGHPVRISHLAVRGLPGSGTPAELMEAAGISAAQIAQAARDILPLCRAVLRVDAVPAEKITESLDLVTQGRESCPLLLASGFVAEQLLLPVAKHRCVLEVLGVDGVFLVAADLGDLLVELDQVRSGAYALFQDRQAPVQRVETAAKLRQQLALPPASGAAGSGLLLDPPGRHQLDHLLTDPVRINAQAVQYLRGGALAQADQAEQDVLSPDVGMTQRDGLAH